MKLREAASQAMCFSRRKKVGEIENVKLGRKRKEKLQGKKMNREKREMSKNEGWKQGWMTKRLKIQRGRERIRMKERKN